MARTTPDGGDVPVVKPRPNRRPNAYDNAPRTATPPPDQCTKTPEKANGPKRRPRTTPPRTRAANPPRPLPLPSSRDVGIRQTTKASKQERRARTTQGRQGYPRRPQPPCTLTASAQTTTPLSSISETTTAYDKQEPTVSHGPLPHLLTPHQVHGQRDSANAATNTSATMNKMPTTNAMRQAATEHGEHDHQRTTSQ